VIWTAAEETVRVDEVKFRAEDPLPRCPHCGGMARPNIMMFNDFYWQHRRSSEQQKRFERWLGELEGKSAKVVVIELGAGMAIPTVRHTSERVVKRLGGTLIRINPREPEAPPGQFSLATGALAGIRELDGSQT
jgi:NAD-dependent SIR2 family protein deacetylase